MDVADIDAGHPFSFANILPLLRMFSGCDGEVGKEISGVKGKEGVRDLGIAIGYKAGEVFFHTGKEVLKG